MNEKLERVKRLFEQVPKQYWEELIELLDGTSVTEELLDYLSRNPTSLKAVETLLQMHVEDLITLLRETGEPK
jgi:hypothetical protein